MSVITKRIIAFALLTMLIMSSFSGVTLATNLFSGEFSAIQGGIVDGSDTANIQNTSTGLSIIPNPAGESSHKPIVIDSYSWESKNIKLSSIRQIQVEYKFSGTTDGLGHPKISIKPMRNGTYLPEPVTFYSYESIQGTTEWKTLTFEVYEFYKTSGTREYRNNISNDLYRKLLSTEEILRQIHFYFFGDTPASELNKSQQLTIGNITLSSTDIVTDKSYIKFDKGFPAAYRNAGVREDRVDYVDVGSTYTVPECPYSLEGFEFDGWVSWYNYKKFYPGDEMTVVGDTMLVADWRSENRNQKVSDFVVVDLQDYITGFISPGTKRGTYSERQIFDGVENFAKFVPDTTLVNKTDENGKDLKSANLDSYSWIPAQIDIREYKYLSVVYYWETENPISAKFQWGIMKSSTDLTQSSYFEDAMEANKWATANFDISSVSSYLSQNASNFVLHQCMVRPFSDRYMYELHPNDKLYLGKAIFYKNKPQSEPAFAQPAINPISGGTIGLTKAMTRGEALVSITRLIGLEGDLASVCPTSAVFTDISTTDPLNAYATMAVDCGWLEGNGTTEFNPNGKLTTSEFLEWLTSISKLGYGASSGTGVGEMARIPANSFLLSAMMGDKPITRGEFIAMSSIAVSGMNAAGASNVPLTSLPQIYDLPVSLSMYKTAATLCGEGIFADGQLVLTLRNVLGNENSITDEIYEKGEKYISDLDKISADRIAEIRNTGNTYYDKYVKDNSTFGNVYFVSNNGKDTNDGKTPENAFATLNKLATVALKYGDAVFFERGSVFRQTATLPAVAGVTYSSYGTGKKPEIWGSNKDLAVNSENWTLCLNDETTGKKIWKYSENMVDTGALFLIKDGEVVSVAAKEIPSYDSTYTDTPWRVRDNTLLAFSENEQLDNDLEFVCFADQKIDSQTGDLVPNLEETTGVPKSESIGELYFRCDKGNPATVYDSIELAPQRHGINVGGKSAITIDNITIKYVGNHGVAAGTAENLTVTNCEIGWIGGAIQHYNAGNNNVGRVARFGNGIEIYGGCSNYVVDNCYVYEVYDAGITHQIGGQTNSIFMDDIDYTNNVIEYCTYNIEYFASPQAESARQDSYCFMKDILFENNILRMAGYGWGQQRPDSEPSSIKGWPRDTNNATNYIIRNNIIDRCTHRLMEVGSVSFGAAPYFDTNTFVQHYGNGYAYFHSDVTSNGTVYYYFSNLDVVAERMAQRNPTFYFAEPFVWEHIYVYHRSNPPGTY